MEMADITDAPDRQLLVGKIAGWDGKYYVGIGIKHVLGGYNQAVMVRPLGGIWIAMRLFGLSLWGLALRK